MVHRPSVRFLVASAMAGTSCRAALPAFPCLPAAVLPERRPLQIGARGDKLSVEPTSRRQSPINVFIRIWTLQASDQLLAFFTNSQSFGEPLRGHRLRTLCGFTQSCHEYA